MGWRSKMGVPEKQKVKINPLTQNPQNPQNLSRGGGFEGFEGIEYRVGKVKNDSEPDPETQYAIDERAAIIEFDGGQVVPYIGPAAVKINSSILGATVDVSLEQDQVVVDGVEYSKAELTDLINRGVSHDALREVHRVKQEFEGEVVPSSEVEKLEPISKW